MRDLKADLELCQRLGRTFEHGVIGHFISETMRIGGKPVIFEITPENPILLMGLTVQEYQQKWELAIRQALAEKARVDRAEQDVSILLDLLMSVAYQACSFTNLEGKQKFDSMAISTWAEVLRTLAHYGKVEITHEVGRRVIARPKEALDRGN